MTEKEKLIRDIHTVRETINRDWADLPCRSATTNALRLGRMLSNVSKILRG